MGSRTLSNYWWGAISLIGGSGFFIAGLYSYYLNFSSISTFWLESHSNGTPLFFNNFIGSATLGPIGQQLFTFLKNIKIISVASRVKHEIAFFPQGLAMCFYGLIGVLLGTFLLFCIFFQIGCGFTEFNKEKGVVRVFRLGFPGKNRYIDYSYNLASIECICVKISSSIVSTSQRGVYMRLKLSENQTRDIPLDLYSEKTSLEKVELQAADLSKFLRVSLSIL